MSLALALALLSAAIWAYLIAARGGFWLERVAVETRRLGEWPEIVAIVPARNEAETIDRVVSALMRQTYPGRFHAFVVDDHSEDGTAAAAGAAAARLDREQRLTVIGARPLPQGWTGKLWAISEGLAAAERAFPHARYAWLSDADVEHPPAALEELVARAEADGLDLVSLMVRLNCRTLAERALVPAFVYFFQMLYPFAWVKADRRKTAAAAGGCVLVSRASLGRIGGIARIKGALIDDCALAAAIKEQGRIWLGLADRSLSLRVYPGFGDIERMVARSAYTQLRYSPLLLLFTMVAMAIVFLVPPVLALGGSLMGAEPWTQGLAAAAWALMTLSFLPTARYYRVSPLWAPALPVIALFYLFATLHSAYHHRFGRGGAWKGRIQARSAG